MNSENQNFSDEFAEITHQHYVTIIMPIVSWRSTKDSLFPTVPYDEPDQNPHTSESMDEFHVFISFTNA